MFCDQALDLLEESNLALNKANKFDMEADYLEGPNLTFDNFVLFHQVTLIIYVLYI